MSDRLKGVICGGASILGASLVVDNYRQGGLLAGLFTLLAILIWIEVYGAWINAKP